MLTASLKVILLMIIFFFELLLLGPFRTCPIGRKMMTLIIGIGGGWV